MSLGFNSDVTVGENVCHVQTENHGHPQCRIETLVYHGGRILHRRNSSYSDFAAGPESERALSERVEDQHRSVIEELRSGAIQIPPVSAKGRTSDSRGIQLRLRNANSWLAAGFATLDIEVLQRDGNQPARGASVEAYLSSARDAAHSTKTGDDGLAQLRFPVAVGASHGAELVIRASAGGSAVDELRYVLRVKPKQNPSEAKS